MAVIIINNGINKLHKVISPFRETTPNKIYTSYFNTFTSEMLYIFKIFTESTSKTSPPTATGTQGGHTVLAFEHILPQHSSTLTVSDGAK